MTPHALLGAGYHYDTESGYFVSEKHRRMAEIIRDYNPELSLMWIPNAQRTPDDPDKPFVVVHTRSDGSQYPVFFLREEDMDNDEYVLVRLFAGDRAKHGAMSILDMVEIREQAQRILEAKQWEEKRAEAREMMTTMLKSPLHEFKHNGKKFYPKGR